MAEQTEKARAEGEGEMGSMKKNINEAIERKKKEKQGKNKTRRKTPKGETLSEAPFTKEGSTSPASHPPQMTRIPNLRKFT